MIRLSRQEALDQARKSMGQYFKGSTGRSSAPQYTPEQMERLAIKTLLDDGDIHPKRARRQLRKIRIKYQHTR